MVLREACFCLPLDKGSKYVGWFSMFASYSGLGFFSDLVIEFSRQDYSHSQSLGIGLNSCILILYIVTIIAASLLLYGLYKMPGTAGYMLLYMVSNVSNILGCTIVAVVALTLMTGCIPLAWRALLNAVFHCYYLLVIWSYFSTIRSGSTSSLSGA